MVSDVYDTLSNLIYPNEPKKHHYQFKAYLKWTEALNFLIKSESSSSLCGKIGHVELENEVLPDIFSQIVFSFDHLGFFNLTKQYKQAPLRAVTISFYYAIYHLCRVMLISQNFSVKDNHQSVANEWYRRFVLGKNLVFEPFSFGVCSLVKKDIDEACSSIRLNQSKVPLWKIDITNSDSSRLACASKLSGEAHWQRENAEKNIKKSKKIEAFRTKVNQDIRDEELGKKVCGFLHQIFCFRGSANYRHSIYFSHDYSVEDAGKLRDNLYDIAKSFLNMGLLFAKKAVSENIWSGFEKEIRKKNKLIRDVWED